MADDERDRRPDGAVAVVRRAPFSGNPQVGARGQRTQQRILDAALRAFGEEGYHGCSIDRITKLARCSRVSFYQYFSSKEDVFRHLAEQVARQTTASTEMLDPLTPELEGWTAMRAWVARYAEIYTRYEPVFHAVATDEALAAMAARTGAQNIARIHSRLVTTMLPPRQLDPVIRLLLECVNHTLDVTGILRSVVPDAYPLEHVEDAITDVLHRTLFGLHADVNVRAPDGFPPPALEFNPAMLEWLRQGDATRESSASGNRALTALLDTGRDVFITRGYHNTRVDDLVAAAGVSHGTFYRYFRNKDELARILVAAAIRTLGTTLMEIPDVLARRRVGGQGGPPPVASPLPRRARHRGGPAARLGRRRPPGPCPEGGVRSASRLGAPADVALPATAGFRRRRHGGDRHGGALRCVRRAATNRRRDRGGRSRHRAGTSRALTLGLEDL